LEEGEDGEEKSHTSHTPLSHDLKKHPVKS
jgi:hypothetical protein